MEFYLSVGSSRIRLPINPESVTCQTGNKTETFNVIELGEIVLPRGQVPTRFTFESFFPGESRKLYIPDWRPPKELVGVFSVWRDQGVKMRFLVTETPINHDVYFDGDGSFEHEWKGGHGDCWYRIRLVQARQLIIPTENELQKMTKTPTRPIPSTPKLYTVRPGDNLWIIAKRILGDGSRWKELYSKNKSVIGPDPNKIYPGQVLRIA